MTLSRCYFQSMLFTQTIILEPLTSGPIQDHKISTSNFPSTYFTKHPNLKNTIKSVNNFKKFILQTYFGIF